MGFDLGVIGLANSGKTSIFNAASGFTDPVDVYPFTTIDTNLASVAVPDPRIDSLVGVYAPKKIVPATMHLVDMPGLAPGSSEGEGMGNKFLNAVRKVDALAHVVRCFENPDVPNVAGEGIDPARDIASVDLELALADLQSLETRIPKIEKSARNHDKDACAKLELIEKIKTALEAGKRAAALEYSEAETANLREFDLLTMKPVLFIANVGEGDAADGGQYLQKVRAIAEKQGARAIAVSAKIEAEARELGQAEGEEMLKELGLGESGLKKIILEGYALLGLITMFTCGPKEVHAWTIRRGRNAKTAAGKIHSDLERGFIRAEVIACRDLLELGSEAACRDKGKLRVEGKDYVVEDGDIVNIRFNV